MEVSELLKEHKKKKGRLINLKQDIENVKEDMEGIQETLSQEEYEFSKEELLEETSLSATSYDNTSAPTNAFSSSTENSALNIDNVVENQKMQYEKRREQLIKSYYNNKEKIKTLEEEVRQLEIEVKELDREVKKIENAVDNLKTKHKFIVNLKYIEGFKWSEVFNLFTEKFPDAEIQTEDGVRQIGQEALKDVEYMVIS